MHGVTTPLLLPRGNIRDAQVATIRNGHPTHCAQAPPAEPQRMQRARVENEKEKTTHYAEKAKYGKKQEGTNKRCPEGLTTDSGTTPPRDVTP